MRQFHNNSIKVPLWGILGLLVFLLLWQIGARRVGSDLILPPPFLVAKELIRIIGEQKFWNAVCGSLLRVVEAFFISSVLGIVVGILSGMKPQFHAFLSPIIVAMQATPVMALILIAMFWFPASQVPVFSAVLMAFPLLYTSAEAGVHAADDKLVQLSTLFHVTRHTMFWKLRLPSAYHFCFQEQRMRLASHGKWLSQAKC